MAYRDLGGGKRMLKLSKSIGVEDVAKLLSFYAERVTGKDFSYRMKDKHTAFVQSPGSPNFYEINHGGAVITEHNFKRNDDVLYGFGYRHQALVNTAREYVDAKSRDYEEENRLYLSIEFLKTDNVDALVNILVRMQDIDDRNKVDGYMEQLKRKYSINENAPKILNEGIERAAKNVPDVEMSFSNGMTQRDMYKQEMKNYFL